MEEVWRILVIFGEIVEISIDSDKIDHNNKIDIEKVNSLVYCARIREYWELEKRLEKDLKGKRNIKKA